LLARRSDKSVAEWLCGGPPTEARSATNQTLFWSPFDVFMARAEGYVARGFRDLKVRVAAGDFAEDVRRITALRSRFGRTVKIAADANGQWSEAGAFEKLRVLADFDLAYVEQPIAAGDWDAIGHLGAESPIPV